MKREQVLKELDGVGDWTSDKCWEQHPIAAEAQRIIQTLEANHNDVVKIKRGTDERLKVALAALQQVYDVCGDNAGDGCDHRMALSFVRQVAGDGFEKATKNIRCKGRMAPSDSNGVRTSPGP